MKQTGEEQRERLNQQLDDEAVADYLLRNPEFFIRNARAVEHMRVPHPGRGAVSLVEWYMVRARSRINALEEKMTVLMEQASDNESLFSRLLHLQRRLASADSLEALLNAFHHWARDLGLTGAAVRLFPDRWRLDAPPGLALSRQAFEPVRLKRFDQQHCYLGPLSGPELLLLLPEAEAVGSVAMSLMGSNGGAGVILFTSRDARHYQQGQGTRLLQEIALMMPDLLTRWIEPV